MGLEYEVKKHPNNSEYYELRVGKEVVGHAVEVDGGYLADRRRKPVKTLQEAAKQCLVYKMNMCMKTHENLRKLLQRI